MSQIEYDFMTSLLADPSQLLEVTDITPKQLEDENMGLLLHALQERDGRVTPAILHADLSSEQEGQRLLRELSASWGFGADTRSVVDKLFRDGQLAGSAVILAEQVRDDTLRRTIRQSLGMIKPDQFASTSDYANALITKLQKNLNQSGGSRVIDTLHDDVDTAIAQWEFQLDNPGKVIGQRVNMGKLDTFTTGYKPGELIMIGGHSGEGKSHVMIHMMLEALQTVNDLTGEPARVAYFSLEMNGRQMNKRFIAKLGRVDMNERVASQETRRRVQETGKRLKQFGDEGRLKLVDPISTSSLDQISREMMRLKQIHGTNFMVVDYAQLIAVGGESKYAEMASISQRLKHLALTLEVPILCGLQLNREALKETKSARPRFYHVADGLDLLRSADYLHMIWQPARHLPAQSVGPWGGKAVLLTEKVRDGEPIPPLYFEAQYKYSSLAPVNDATAQALCSEESQRVLYATREAKTPAKNGVA